MIRGVYIKNIKIAIVIVSKFCLRVIINFWWVDIFFSFIVYYFKSLKFVFRI